MSNFIRPYRVGDVVLLDGEEQVVIEVEVRGVNDYAYATTSSAWHSHQSLALIRECDAQSIGQIVTHLSELDEEMNEEIGEDEEEEL